MERSPAYRTVLGSVLIYQPANYSFTDDIGQGDGELADLVPGAPVVFRDDRGVIVGRTVLEAGVLSDEGNCRMRYMINLPELDQYRVSIGDREPDRIRRAQMRSHEEDGTWRLTQDWDRQGGIRRPMGDR
jgi:lipoprotein-anchoring transpeptidase ErfK/SrfK